MTFQNQLSTKQFIPLCVGCTDKLRKDIEVRLLDFYRPMGSRALFKHEEITQEWLCPCVESPFSEGRPKIERTSNGFLGSVVEVIAE